MAPQKCPLCGIDFDTTSDEDGQREEEAEFVRPEEHYGPCMEVATRKLRMELELMRMQKEHDAIQEIQEQPTQPMDLMSLVMETESARLRKSEPSRVHVFTLLYEEGLQRAQVRREVLEVLRLAREEERRRAALECMICGVKKSMKRLHFLESCSHHSCRECLRSFVMQKVEAMKCSEITCHVCSVPLSQLELKLLLSEDELERYLRASVEEVLLANKDRYLKCPNSRCKNIIEKVEDPAVTPNKLLAAHQGGDEWTRGPQGEGGSDLSPEAAQHRDKYRFRCRECGTECCGSCQAVPYHLGLTCEQYALWLAAKRCRYCDIALDSPSSSTSTSSSTPSPSTSPSSPSPLQRQKRPRRHSIKGKERREREEDDSDSDGDGDEERHVREAVAATHAQERRQVVASDEKAAVVDCCTAAECVAKAKLACVRGLSCSHPCGGIVGEALCPPCLHIDCAREGMQTGSDLCLICYVEELRAAPCVQLSCGHFFHFECAKSKVSNGWSGSRITFGYLECPLCKQLMRHPALDPVLGPHLELFGVVKEKALQRLRLLSLEKCEAVTSPTSPFYGNPSGYALHRFSFYRCYKCKTPYFGGDKICEADQQAREFNPKDLVCGRCCDLTGINECPDHGREYIEYKCRFCCSIAVWFCWGTTHFCDACHQNAAELITADKRELPACTCKIDHPPNGEEFSLGCSYCRALRE